MNLYNVIMILLLAVSKISFAQEAKEESNKEKVNITNIDLPTWFGYTEAEIIKAIEAKENLDWSEYIQLAVSYAELDAEASKISELLDSSFNNDLEASCRRIQSILACDLDWKILTKHRRILKDKLNKYKCESN